MAIISMHSPEKTNGEYSTGGGQQPRGAKVPSDGAALVARLDITRHATYTP
jgi:hypothetical protein